MRTVLFVIDEYHIGGVTTFVKLYADAAIQNGYKAVIIGFTGNLQKPADFFYGCEVVLIPKRLRYTFLGLLKCFPYFFIHFIRLVKRREFCAIHFSMTWTTLFALCYFPIWKIKRVITFYGAQHLESSFDIDEAGNSIYLHDFKYSINSFITRVAQLFSLIGCEKIITFSQYSKAIILLHFGKKIEKKVKIIPGLIANRTPSYIVKDKEETFTIINFGRMDIRKGIDLLIGAGSILKKEKISFKIIIASPLVESELIRHYRIYEQLKLGVSLHFVHGLDLEEKNQLLRQADLFVMPSRDLETFGMTMLESLSHGVPVIGVPTGAIPEVLRKIDPRLIAKEASAPELAKKILWFYRLSNSERQKIRKKCFERTWLHYSFEDHQKEIVSIYEK